MERKPDGFSRRQKQQPVDSIHIQISLSTFGTDGFLGREKIFIAFAIFGTISTFRVGFSAVQGSRFSLAG